MIEVVLFLLGFMLGVVVHDKVRDIKDQDKKYNNTNKRGNDGC